MDEIANHNRGELNSNEASSLGNFIKLIEEKWEAEDKTRAAEKVDVAVSGFGCQLAKALGRREPPNAILTCLFRCRRWRPEEALV